MPSQIAPPIQYQDGDAINGDAFNQHVSHATLLSGSISEQTDISVSAVPNVNKLDSIVIYDESEATTNKLRKATIEQLFNNGSSLPTSELITSKITAPAWNDIVVTPKIGVLHIGRNYTSNDGFNVTVQDVNHGYDTGTLVKFTASSFGTHNGTFQVTKLTNDSYRFNNGLTVATSAGGGTINSEKVPTVAVIGSATINDDLLVAGNAKISGAVNVGSLLIGGKTPSTIEDNFLGVSVKTVSLPPKGWGLVEYQTQSFNVPPGETWTFVWTANTNQMGSPGNTRPEGNYQWQIRAINLTGSVVDTAQAYMQGYGGTSITARSIVVKNEGTTGNNHTVYSPTVSVPIAGTMNLTWTTVAIGGRAKWDTVGTMIITLYRQKTASLNYGHPAVL